MTQNKNVNSNRNPSPNPSSIVKRWATRHESSQQPTSFFSVYPHGRWRINILLGTSLLPSRIPVLDLCLVFNQTCLCIRMEEANRCIPSRCCLKCIRNHTPRVVLSLPLLLPFLPRYSHPHLLLLIRIHVCLSLPPVSYSV
jgi:hypothetical protein